MASPQNPIKVALRLRIKALMALMTPENRNEQSAKIADKVCSFNICYSIIYLKLNLFKILGHQHASFLKLTKNKYLFKYRWGGKYITYFKRNVSIKKRCKYPESY